MDAADTGIHGDLHPRNVPTEAGACSGVIDWGHLAAGDPATHLASIWMPLDGPAERENALANDGPVSAATRARARGWVPALGLVRLETGLADHPRNTAIGVAIPGRILSET